MKFVKKRMLKSTLAIFISLLFIPIYTLNVNAETKAKPDDTNSESVYFVNTDTGKVIYEKNPDKQIVPASLVKMMTVIVALETASEDNMETFLDQPITAKPYIFDRLFGLNASTADIRPDEVLPMKDVLYASMLPSACEATMVLADYVSGENTEDFVEKMNQKGKEIGMDNTKFVDPDGLDENSQRSTARDLYKLTEYCLKNSTFKEIALSQQYMMSATNKHAEQRRIQHTNHMMSKFLGGSFYDSRVKGLKTGTAGGLKNLISTAEQSNYHYTIVTMGAKDNGKNLTYVDHRNLYDWAFGNLKFVTVGKPGEKVIPNNIKVNFGKKTDTVILTPKDQVIELLPNNIKPEAILWDSTSLPKELNAPIKKGHVVGEVSLFLQEREIDKVEVIVDKDININVFSYILHILKTIFSSIFFWIAFVIFGIILSINVISRRKKRTNRVNRKRAKRR